ncbi:NF-X1-type zinc finger protein NFXL1 [Teleopsis dalmanni]|uniref:NF-X1-type zinc finger protein NFXL1 n=1 Tax=Teleopsis dalmanni TaxID=139649 RepID=UPI0018CEC2A2|nr:NF-X1-type zinc finger protein NFXL1 [Teleopsis dalmanni]
MDSTKLFVKVKEKNLDSAIKCAENFIPSSEDEDELDEKTILSNLYQHYKESKDSQLLKKTSGILENVLQSGAATCLICIGSVRRTDSIWSCRHCYCFFHLNCIRRWANDSIAQIKAQTSQDDQGYYNHLGEFIPPKKKRGVRWFCPQCREEYEPVERPTVYKCFCGNEENPTYQPFLVPHSCGEICSKQLQPQCGHKCMLLCHPGPCPPCAQYAVTACQCGHSAKKSIRCAEKYWQCTKKCTLLLSCGKHVCNQICHKAGFCPPCSSTSKQSCECGAEIKTRNCSDLKWKCQKICNKKYACGIHKCKVVCHSGDCGECPLGLPRSCPCGKTKKTGPCSEVVDTCGDTCQKLLACGTHYCTQRCHRGQCNLCMIIIKKKCRCGLHEKELPCSKEFSCEMKCKQIRECGKHACNRKCCDGNCPPCDKICGKQLSCKKHKCKSICHDGPCYPCELKSQINCPCGKTSKTVPCGREKRARIVCLETCRIKSKCQHPNNHRCHRGDCPPCNQKCNVPLETCSHLCLAKCHSVVKVEIRDANLTKKLDTIKKFEYKSLPHPKCEQSVMATCVGGHETSAWPCWLSSPSSCKRPCNRLLRCGNHKCQLICHPVPNLLDMNEQIGCGACEEGCNITRPTGCIHPCRRACHLPPCAVCNVNMKSNCHCGLSQVLYKCSEYFRTDGTENDIMEQREKLKSCGNRCLKNYSCGHRCVAICHSGKCPNPESCRKKVRIYCKCKRLKIEVSCDKHRDGLKEIPCDQNCVETRNKQEELQKQEAEKLLLEEEAKNRLEVEQFEKKFGKRKFKERKTQVEHINKPFNWKQFGIYAGIAIAILIAVIVAVYTEN